MMPLALRHVLRSRRCPVPALPLIYGLKDVVSGAGSHEWGGPTLDLLGRVLVIVLTEPVPTASVLSVPQPLGTLRCWMSKGVPAPRFLVVEVGWP